jgi:hypothetical protein
MIYSNGSTTTPPQLSGSTFWSTVIYTSSSMLKYMKKSTFYYYYPKELTFVSADPSTYIVDEDQGLVIFTSYNTYKDYLPYKVELMASGVSPKNYTASAQSKVDVEMYD